MVAHVAAVGAALLAAAVWAVNDVPSQVFSIGLYSAALSLLVWAVNEVRRTVERTSRENARLREALWRMIDSSVLDARTRRAVKEIMSDDDAGEDEEAS